MFIAHSPFSHYTRPITKGPVFIQMEGAREHTKKSIKIIPREKKKGKGRCLCLVRMPIGSSCIISQNSSYAIFSFPSANGPREWLLSTVTPTVHELNLRSRLRCPTANMPSDGFKIAGKSFLSARARRSSFKIYFRFLKDAKRAYKKVNWK